MNTDEGTASDPVADAPADPIDDAADDPTDNAAEDQTGPDWWHRDHPVFSALSGFFTGLLTVIVVPGGFAAILNALFTYERAEDFFPFVLLIFVVPIGLIVATRTRRFGKYMLLGMLLTAVVVVGVAALVLWLLYRFDS